jgi:hypothetical protein
MGYKGLIYKIPRNTDVDLFKGKEPSVRSKAGMAMFLVATDGMVIMSADLVKVESQ